MPKAELQSFIDMNGNLNYWCAACGRWHCRKATKKEIEQFDGKE